VVPEQGFGLLGLRERAGRLGGSVDVVSEPGHGTTVRVEVPG
jgi:signal transduction histidine kinase